MCETVIMEAKTMTTDVLLYRPNLDIRNVAQLPPGRGARYLEVLPGESHDEFIAVGWRRKPKCKTGRLLIDFERCVVPHPV